MCRHISIWGFRNPVCLSVPRVCLHPEKRNHLSFVNISPTLVIDKSLKTSSRVLHHGNSKIWFFSLKFEIYFWLVLKNWNHISFVNISSTLVIDTSMEKSSSSLSWKVKNLVLLRKKRLTVFAVMFCKQFLAYAVHIDWCYHSFHKHSRQHAPIWRHRGGIVVPSRVDI